MNSVSSWPFGLWCRVCLELVQTARLYSSSSITFAMAGFCRGRLVAHVLCENTNRNIIKSMMFAYTSINRLVFGNLRLLYTVVATLTALSFSFMSHVVERKTSTKSCVLRLFWLHGIQLLFDVLNTKLVTDMLAVLEQLQFCPQYPWCNHIAAAEFDSTTLHWFCCHWTKDNASVWLVLIVPVMFMYCGIWRRWLLNKRSRTCKSFHHHWNGNGKR